MTSKYQMLLQPAKVGGIASRNRIVMAPMGTRIADLDGSINDRLKKFYEVRARGGAGIVMVEASEVTLKGRSAVNHPRADLDEFIPGLTELADVIHEGGAVAVIQLLHGGRVVKRRFAGVDPVAPSAIPAPGGEMPRELTKQEIDEIVGLFAAAAARCQVAGFDGVEIHGAHVYLINQFFSPDSNQRRDEYGGSVENRARFAVEVTRAVRAAVGPSYPVWFRLNGREFGIANGVSIEDAVISSRLVAQAGADAIHVSSYGVNHTEMLRATPMVKGMLAPLAAKIKQAVGVSVIAVGNLTPALGEQLLREGNADLIAFGHALLADPDFPNKLASGAEEDIRPCITCLECNYATMQQQPVRCAVNQFSCREAEEGLAPMRRAKKVLVVGAGPAGLEAARVAALRGHAVTVVERASKPGGLLTIAGEPPLKGDMALLGEYLARQATKAGAELRLGQEVTAETVRAIGPDAVVIATGARPQVPDIPGLRSLPFVLANDVLAGVAETGKRVVVVGGEMVGCETAECLAERGRTVVVTRRGPSMAMKVNPVVRTGLLNRLEQKGVRLMCDVQYRRASEAGLLIVDGQGREEVLPADTLVIAAGATPTQELAGALAGTGAEVHVIGDCREPRGIRDALIEGYAVGQEL